VVKCADCGAEVKYIPVFDSAQGRTAIMVEPGYTEVVQDTGRVTKGHLRHSCPKIPEKRVENKQ